MLAQEFDLEAFVRVAAGEGHGGDVARTVAGGCGGGEEIGARDEGCAVEEAEWRGNDDGCVW